MKLSVETINLLKNFASINPSIFIFEGSRLATKSVASNIVAMADIKEKFDVEFGIYELPNFLSAYGMMDDPELEFHEDHMNIISGKSKCRYNFCDPEVVVKPKSSEAVKLPTQDVEFDLTEADLDKITKIANTLSLDDICIHNEDGRLIVSVVDARTKGGNKFSIDVGESDHKNKFQLFIKSDNLKIIKDSYRVTISSKGLSEFKGTKCTYIVVLEKKGQKW